MDHRTLLKKILETKKLRGKIRIPLENRLEKKLPKQQFDQATAFC